MSQLRSVRVPTPAIPTRIAGNSGRLVNISATGALVHLGQALPEREWPMVMDVKPEPVEFRVRVIRSNAVPVQSAEAAETSPPRFAIAVAFTDLSPDAQSLVKQLCGPAFEERQ
jgi:hypothetical protein